MGGLYLNQDRVPIDARNRVSRTTEPMLQEYLSRSVPLDDGDRDTPPLTSNSVHLCLLHLCLHFTLSFSNS